MNMQVDSCSSSHADISFYNGMAGNVSDKNYGSEENISSRSSECVGDVFFKGVHSFITHMSSLRKILFLFEFFDEVQIIMV